LLFGQVLTPKTSDGQVDALYTLNETGQAIWQKLDGVKTLAQVAAALAVEFAAPRGELESDVLGFASELTRRGILAVKAEG
jgi:hypothetical protein